MDVDEFADAYSANITKTFNTTRSDSIDTIKSLGNSGKQFSYYHFVDPFNC